MNWKLFLTLVAFCVSSVVFAQGEEQNTQMKVKNRAEWQILKLKKNGVLLVRLSDRKEVFANLRKQGYHAYVDKAEKELKEENNEIMAAFAKEYDFSPVYFFYSSQSSFFLKKQWDSVSFFDAAGDPVSQDSVVDRFLLVAEFGQVMSDTNVGREVVYCPRCDHKDMDANVDMHYKKSNIEIKALVVKSDELVQLDRPFPFFVRTYQYLLFNRKKTKVVGIFNRLLWEFLDEVEE